jgi:osmotically-inducible protein OsmY
VTNIGVAVKDGIVTLTGSVDSFAEKQAAARSTKIVSGVRTLANEIEVKLPGLSGRSDVDIARAALNALEWNHWVPRARIKIKVEQRWLTLVGEVDRSYQKLAAESAVEHLMGVRGVTNQITIKPVMKPVELKVKIVKALERRAIDDAQRIEVETFEHRVILRGKVRSLMAREDAERAALSAPGVTMVSNYIVVEP